MSMKLFLGRMKSVSSNLCLRKYAEGESDERYSPTKTKVGQKWYQSIAH
jgi:hypothetical protein